MLKIKKLTGGHFGPVDLDVGAGECFTIHGASGAGKSLLLRAITDLDPNEGEVWCDGRLRSEMSAPEWRRLVGLVPAESGWWADRVGDHFDQDVVDRGARNGVGCINGYLDAVDLPHEVMDWDVDRLSTGERHRLALVRCLLLNPRVVLLDEPTAALDEKTTARVELMVQQQLKMGKAIVVVTHDPQQSGRIASRNAIMDKGRLSFPVAVAS